MMWALAAVVVALVGAGAYYISARTNPRAKVGAVAPSHLTAPSATRHATPARPATAKPTSRAPSSADIATLTDTVLSGTNVDTARQTKQAADVVSGRWSSPR